MTTEIKYRPILFPFSEGVPPEATGAATITVTVTGGEGGEATEEIIINVCDCCCK